MHVCNVDTYVCTVCMYMYMYVLYASTCICMYCMHLHVYVLYMFSCMQTQTMSHMYSVARWIGEKIQNFTLLVHRPYGWCNPSLYDVTLRH